MGRSLKEIYEAFIEESIIELVSSGGEVINDQTIIDGRLEICKGCPLYIDGKILPWYTTKICDKSQGGCGCSVEIKTKMKTHRNPLNFTIEKTVCPLGKW